MKLISVVVPCYNEEQNVEVIYEAVYRVFSSLHPLVNFEMIYVNDGSTDHTAFKIKQLASTKKMWDSLTLVETLAKKRQ